MEAEAEAEADKKAELQSWQRMAMRYESEDGKVTLRNTAHTVSPADQDAALSQLAQTIPTLSATQVLSTVFETPVHNASRALHASSSPSHKTA